MKAIIVFILLLGSCLPVTSQRRCSGTSYCSACTSCNYCKNCNKYGGSCGVCGGSEDVKRAKPSKRKRPAADNSYSPATEHAYETAATDTVIPTSYEPVYDSHYKEEESGGGTTLLLILIAVILFIRWVNKRSK